MDKDESLTRSKNNFSHHQIEYPSGEEVHVSEQEENEEYPIKFH